MCDTRFRCKLLRICFALPSPGFVQGCVDAGPSVAFELMNAYAAARASDGPLASALQEAGGGTLAAAIAEYHEFLKANLPLLVRAPSLLLQQASNAPEGASFGY